MQDIGFHLIDRYLFFLLMFATGWLMGICLVKVNVFVRHWFFTKKFNGKHSYIEIDKGWIQ